MRPNEQFHVENLFRTVTDKTPFELVENAVPLRQAISEALPHGAFYVPSPLITEMLNYYSDTHSHELEIDSSVKRGVSETQRISSADQATAIKVAFEKLKDELESEDLDTTREPRVLTKPVIYSFYRNLLTLLATVACPELNSSEKLKALTSWVNELRAYSDVARMHRLIMEVYKFDLDHFTQQMRYVIAVKALRETNSESKFFPLYKALDDLYTRLFAKGFRLQWPIGMTKANKLFSASVDFFMQALKEEDTAKAELCIKDYKAKMRATTWHPALRAVLAMLVVGALAFGLMIALQVAMGIAPMVAISFALLSVANTGVGNVLALFTVAVPAALASTVGIMKSHSYYPTQKITHLITAAEKIISVDSESVVARTDSSPAISGVAVPGFQEFMKDPLDASNTRRTRVAIARQTGQRSIISPLRVVPQLPVVPQPQKMPPQQSASSDLSDSGGAIPRSSSPMVTIAFSVAGRRRSSSESPVSAGVFGSRAVRHPGVPEAVDAAVSAQPTLKRR